MLLLHAHTMRRLANLFGAMENCLVVSREGMGITVIYGS
jgi:hypothetical protein